jgi:ribosomal protein S18 acetylase RimI-like enzyme
MRQSGARAATRGLCLREETDADLPFLSSLYASTRIEELVPVPWPQAQKAAFLAQQFCAQRAHYRRHYEGAEWLIVEHGGDSIGRLYIAEWTREIRIVDIALIPQARGQGFGTALLCDLIEAAGAAGKPVSIHVERMNPALSLYNRLGFRQVEDKGVYLLMEHSRAALPTESRAAG